MGARFAGALRAAAAASSSRSAASRCVKRSRELVREGRLIRSHGRGTFVAQAQLRKPVFPLVSFTQDVREHGMQPGARVLEFEVISPPPHVVSALQLEAGDRMILLKRLRLANGKPMAVETVHLPSHRCPGLQGEHLTDQSLYETLSRTYGIVPTRANQQWQAVACPAADARLLEIPKGNPVLRIEQTTFDRNGRPFEHLESFFRGDKFIFYAESRGADPLHQLSLRAVAVRIHRHRRIMSAAHTSVVEAEGHLVDSQILTGIFDAVIRATAL